MFVIPHMLDLNRRNARKGMPAGRTYMPCLPVLQALRETAFRTIAEHAGRQLVR
jgi:hypothetical protein